MFRKTIFTSIAAVLSAAPIAHAQVTDRFLAYIDNEMSKPVVDETKFACANALFMENDDTIIAIYEGAHRTVQVDCAHYTVTKLYDENYFTVERATRVVDLARQYSPYKDVWQILSELPDAVFDYERRQVQRNCHFEDFVDGGPEPSFCLNPVTR